MLAASHLLERSNPRLLDWSKRAWEAWREQEQAPHRQGPMPSVIIVATLTCLDDLRLHVGVLQLLQRPGIRANLVLTLPTAEALGIARTEARRDGWLGLVTMIAEGDWPALQAGLAPEQRLVFFPGPAVFSEPQLASAHDWLRTDLPRDPPRVDDVRVVRAGDPGEIVAAPLSAMALSRLQGADPDQLGGMDTGQRPAAARGQATEPPDLQPDEGSIVLPPLGRGDELAILACPGSAQEQVIARFSGTLHEGERRLCLSPTPTLLTTSPRHVRIERHRGQGDAEESDLLFHVPPAQIEPWMLSAFLNRGGAGNPVVQAFSQGTGCRLAFAEDEPERLRDIPVVWGVLRQSDRILDQARRQSLYFYYIDHAYFDRGHSKSYRIGRNAYEAGPVRDCPPDRFEALHVPIGPWRKGGREIIVCPPTDYFMAAHGCSDWLETTLATLKKVSDRPVVVRAKPQPGEAAVPLPQALETAHALVTHSSNVAIEAACLGTPVFVSPASAAAPVGRTDLEAIESPSYPDRASWLAHLAYNQFTFEEIGDGRAWRMLRENEGRAFV